MDLREPLDELVSSALRLLKHDKTHDEIIILKTAAGNTYYQLIRCSGVVRRDGLPEETVSLHEDVGKLLVMLQEREDTHVKYVLAVANGNVVKLLNNSQYSAIMPPFCVCKGLLELDTKNADAIILANETHNMSVIDSMPPQEKVIRPALRGGFTAWKVTQQQERSTQFLCQHSD